MFYSLRSRLILAFFLLLILPFTAAVYFMSSQSALLIRSMLESSALQTIDQYASRVTTLLRQIEDAGNQVLSSGITQEWLSAGLNGEDAQGARIPAKLELRRFFSSYAFNNSAIVSLSAFTGEEGGLWTLDRSYSASPWYRQYLAADTRWTLAHRDTDQPDENLGAIDVNSYIVPLVHLQLLRPAGIIKINYSTAQLLEDIDGIRLSRTGRTFLLDAAGSSVLNQDLSDVGEVLRQGLARAHDSGELKGMLRIRQANGDYLLFFRKLPAQNWMILGEVPEKELYASITRARQAMLYVSLGLLIVAVLVAIWISVGITRPLGTLTEAIRHVKYGRFDQALKVMPDDTSKQSEVYYVLGSFQQMTGRLKYLIEMEFEQNLRRQNAEYKALLLQINPHFYTNTLEIISGLAALGREDLVMDATEALGKMMRYSLNMHSDLAQVGEEFSYIRDYAFILKLRHEDRLCISIEQDPAADHLRIVKFLLQPLVENAVKYSLEKEGPAVVSISSALSGDRLCLTVQDNGIGMSQELIGDIGANHEPNNMDGVLNAKGRSIGLRNVLARCRLYYGSRFQAAIEAELGTGTKITLELPAGR